MKNKYNAKKVKIYGRTFDSIGESKRALFLMDAEKRGVIKNLEYQINYPIIINGIKICTYKADFRYKIADLIIVEDFKGMITPIFKLKAKLVKACYGIDIKIVTKPTEYCI